MTLFCYTLNTLYQFMLKSIINLGSPKTNRTPIYPNFFVKVWDSAMPRAIFHSSTLLDGANGWQILVDFENQKLVFPSEIYSTPQRPDIIIWSKKLHKVYLVEFTCPAEQGIEPPRSEKDARYNELFSVIDKNNDSPLQRPVYVVLSLVRAMYS